MEISLIIAAGGSGKRFGGSTAKQYLKIDGVTVLEKALDAFSRFNEITEIIITCDNPEKVKEVLGEKAAGIKLVLGGKERQDSIKNGLQLVTKRHVLIHDAARCFVSPRVIQNVIDALAEGAVSAVPTTRPKNTIRTPDVTLNRNKLYEVQTPQGFQVDVLRFSYEMAYKNNFYGTDDASLVDYASGKSCTKLVEGDYENIKITTPDDLAGIRKMDVRVGNGYDVHQLVEGRTLMLGCTQIPYEKGLLGHSDADVLAHAMADAMLGAAALGDIGHLFPDSGPGSAETEGMAGEEILKRTAALVREKGFTISMIDGTVIAEKPKLAPHILTMRQNTAAALGLEVDRVSIKATTEEKLGQRSREGMAALATCTLVQY